MFGYIRAFKPYMRVCEYDTYRAVYCGLCKKIGKDFGFIPRFTLSYDFTFLALMDLSLNEIRMSAQRERCIAHPLKKCLCVDCKDKLGYSADSAMLLIYHKLKDDLADKELKGKIRALTLIPFFKGAYKKASVKYRELANTIEKQMVFQRKIESEKCANIDLACEPTAKIMEAIFGELDKAERHEDLKRFGYLLGRYIYLCDAFDDVREDCRKGNYNPLLIEFKADKNMQEIPDAVYEKMKEYVKNNVNFTLGDLAETYVRLNIKAYKPIVDNIIYLGLRSVYELIEAGKFNRKNERKENNEKSI